MFPENPRYRNASLAIFLLAFSLVVFRLINVSAYDEGKARDGLHGDGYSDINTLSAAKYFLDSGFSSSAFLPIHHYSPKDKEYHPGPYTHYPALPDILAGVYARLFQSWDERVLRIIPALISIFFFFFIYKLLFTLINEERKAFIGSVVLWAANYYICWADGLHQHLYGELLKWLYTYGLFKYYESERKSKFTWVLLLLILVAETNISFEQPVYLGILTLGFSLIYGRKVFNTETITAALAVVTGFLLHVWQNAVYLGSLSAALEDLSNSFLHRTAGVSSPGNVPEREVTRMDILMIPFTGFNRMERFYLFPGWFILFLFIYNRRSFKITYPKLYRISWALLAASFAWAVVMFQHATIHAFTNKHFSTWYALVAAICIPLYLEKVSTAFRQKEILPKLGHSIVILYALSMCFTQQIMETWLKYGFLYRHG